MIDLKKYMIAIEATNYSATDIQEYYKYVKAFFAEHKNQLADAIKGELTQRKEDAKQIDYVTSSNYIKNRFKQLGIEDALSNSYIPLSEILKNDIFKKFGLECILWEHLTKDNSGSIKLPEVEVFRVPKNLSTGDLISDIQGNIQDAISEGDCVLVGPYLNKTDEYTSLMVHTSVGTPMINEMINLGFKTFKNYFSK